MFDDLREVPLLHLERLLGEVRDLLAQRLGDRCDVVGLQLRRHQPAVRGGDAPVERLDGVLQLLDLRGEGTGHRAAGEDHVHGLAELLAQAVALEARRVARGAQRRRLRLMLRHDRGDPVGEVVAPGDVLDEALDDCVLPRLRR
ncbi:MAG TPA: hypothetical protein VEL07_19455 [Planctomycetota bacterium]|nr:hypothetical protein [Planctomycetota bacterium]